MSNLRSKSPHEDPQGFIGFSSEFKNSPVRFSPNKYFEESQK